MWASLREAALSPLCPCLQGLGAMGEGGQKGQPHLPCTPTSGSTALQVGYEGEGLPGHSWEGTPCGPAGSHPAAWAAPTPNPGACTRRAEAGPPRQGVSCSEQKSAVTALRRVLSEI